MAHTLAHDGAIVTATMSGKPLPTDRWVSVTMLTLVVDADAGLAWARNAVGALVEVLPDAQRWTLEGQTHQADPEVLTPVLEKFFAG